MIYTFILSALVAQKELCTSELGIKRLAEQFNSLQDKLNKCLDERDTCVMELEKSCICYQTSYKKPKK